MNLQTIKKGVHSKCLEFRALDRLVSSDAFEEALNLDPSNIRVQFALINGNVVWLEAWIKETLIKDIGEMSLRELRDCAASLGIRNYTSHNKETLLILVNHARRAQKAAIGMPA